MEAAIRALPPGGILSLVNGAFSERFAHIAEMCGREVDRYEVGWGEVHSVDELDSRLSVLIGVSSRTQAVLWGVNHGFTPDHNRIEHWKSLCLPPEEP